MLPWRRSAERDAEEPVVAAVDVEDEIPGLIDAKAKLRDAQRCVEGIELDKTRAEQAVRERRAELAELERRRNARDQTVTPDDIEKAEAAIAGAVREVAHHAKAIPGAKAKVEQAERDIHGVLKEECKRLAALAQAESASSMAQSNALLTRGGTLNSLSLRLQNGGINEADSRKLLAQAAQHGIVRR
jgi:multidrug resistance efflux pump